MTRDEMINEFLYGWTEGYRWQQPLMVQLRERLIHGIVTVSDGTSGGKPKSKPPTDLAVLDLYSDCKTEITIVLNHDERSLVHLMELRCKVRRMLGYDAPLMMLANMVCHVCGGKLTVAEDASTSVSCTSAGCDNEYKQDDWIDILVGEKSECA